jgi:hypothetical protein
MKFDQTQLMIMEIAGYKYPQFEFSPEWLIFSESIADIDERMTFLQNITHYALSELEPDLSGAQLEYFNAHIRPNIDRQHAKMLPHLKRLGYEK